MKEKTGKQSKSVDSDWFRSVDRKENTHKKSKNKQKLT